MKRNAIIYIGVLLLLLAAVTAWRMRPEPVEGSELYQRYKDQPGVRVGFIKDFPLNDTLTCDVTTFEALTDEGWQWMQREIVNEKKAEDSVYLALGWDIISAKPSDVLFHQAPHNRPHDWQEVARMPKDERRDEVMVSKYFRWVAIYQTFTKVERDVITEYYVDMCFNDEPFLLPQESVSTTIKPI